VKPGLLLIGGVTERMRARIEAQFTLHTAPDGVENEIVAVLTNGHDGLRPEVMDRLPALKVISCFGVGYDAIDAVAAAKRGILVSHTPNVLNDEVANTAIMLWMAVSRKLVHLDQYVRAGRWATEGNPPLTRTIQGKTVGILGLGRIGQAIADRLAVFDAVVLYHSRSAKDVAFEYVDDLREMAKRADCLIVITPGGPGTRHLVDADVIEALGPQGILINVARGSVVDETALTQALEDGRLGGAGLDVFDAEPQVPEALRNLENVVLQPHIGSATIETRQAMGDLTCDNLSRFLEDGTVLTPVPECAQLGRI
jgi:lactate dehydrogenase-like 2-hydroxyacid dehydrogenase